MNKMKTSCSRCVDGRLSCSYCGNFVIKNGKTKGNKQRYLCKHCNITRVAKVTRIDFGLRFDRQIIKLIKEGCGIRSIGRLLEISPTTVIRKTIGISDRIKVPLNLLKGRSYQVDELHTYIGNKDQEICVIYSWDAVEK